jgi:hypothetical protein
MPFVRGHALYMQARHGGTANNDTIDAQNIAGLRRGGMLPPASGYPAEMRATRALRRRCRHRMRKRAELLPQVPQTHGQYNWPELGTKIATPANRAGVAERLPAPAVPQRIAVARALIDSDAPLLRALALPIGQTATQQEAHTLDWRQTVPGRGTLLSLGLLYARHDMARVPRGQACGSYGRVGTCAQESAGTPAGTSGTKSGQAHLTWACSEAAVVCLRNHPAGQQYLARFEKKPGKGTA